MVSRQDIRDLNGEINDLIEAMDELEELHEKSQDEYVTIDDAAYAEAQEKVKKCVSELAFVSDDMIDRTDALEDSEGNELVQLPNAALSRSGSSRELPEEIGDN